MKRLLLHIGALILATIIIVWLAMLWLGGWTHHGEITEVPSVRNMPYAQAEQRLSNAGLKVELLDSLYESSAFPGSVLNQTPREGAKVKPGRTVYVTINAFSPKLVTVPSLTDNSVRQAITTLNGLGITDVTEKRVPSEFDDLVLNVTYKGYRLAPGTKVPVNAHLVLEVGQSYVPSDSISADSII